MDAMPSLFPDYKYFELVAPRKHARRDALLNLRSTYLMDVAKAFFNNIARTDSFSWFPAHVAAKALRKPGEEDEDDDDARRLRIGVPFINEMLRHELGANQSMQNILFSIVIESWTAFETLAADLWAVALDEGLPEWRKRGGVRYDKPRFCDSEPLNEIDFAAVADPQENYGSFLRDTEKLSFQKLPKIIEAYRVVFRKKSEELFQKEDRYIFALSAVRNVIVHKAGVADRKYVAAVKQFSELNSIAKDKPIHLDGDIVRKLKNAAINVGNGLLSFVDQRLESNT